MVLQFEVDIELLNPGQTTLAELLEELVGVELLNVEDTLAAPYAACEHRCSEGCRHTRSETYGLGTSLAEGYLVVTVVVNVVCALLAILDASYTAADRGLAVVVSAERLRIGKPRCNIS